MADDAEDSSIGGSSMSKSSSSSVIEDSLGALSVSDAASHQGIAAGEVSDDVSGRGATRDAEGDADAPQSADESNEGESVIRVGDEDGVDEMPQDDAAAAADPSVSAPPTMFTATMRSQISTASPPPLTFNSVTVTTSAPQPLVIASSHKHFISARDSLTLGESPIGYAVPLVPSPLSTLAASSDPDAVVADADVAADVADVVDDQAGASNEGSTAAADEEEECNDECCDDDEDGDDDDDDDEGEEWDNSGIPEGDEEGGADAPTFPEEDIQQLMSIGASRAHAISALTRTSGDVGKSAAVVTEERARRRHGHRSNGNGRKKGKRRRRNSHQHQSIATLIAADPDNPRHAPRNVPASQVKGILRKNKFVLSETALLSGSATASSPTRGIRFGNLPDIDESKATTGSGSSSGRSGSELFSFYISTCSRRDVEPWEPLLRQMKKATNARQRLHTIELRNFRIARRSAEVFVEVVMNNPSLLWLVLERTELEDDVLRILLDGLLFHNKIEWLNIAHNDEIRQGGFRALSDFMVRSARLRFLDVSAIPVDPKMASLLAHALAAQRSSLLILRMQDCSLKPPALEMLVKGLRLSKVMHLNLRYNQLTTAAAPMLSDLVRFGKNLTKLDLRNNDLRNGSMSMLGEALAHNTSLKQLRLWENNITSEGLVLLSDGLSRNRTLRLLDLSYNPCGHPRGLEALCSAVMASRSIQTLKLAGTEISAEGAIAISGMLPEVSLESLDLSHNRLTIAGLIGLCASMRHNTTLLDLDVTANPNDPNEQLFVEEIIAICERNRTGSAASIKRTIIEPPTKQQAEQAASEEVKRLAARGRESAARLQDSLRNIKNAGAQVNGSGLQMVQDLRREANEIKIKLQGLVSRLAVDAAELPQVLQVSETLARAGEMYDAIVRKEGAAKTAAV